MAKFYKESNCQRLNPLFLALLLISPAFSADSSLQQYASQPRWGQASLLLPDHSLVIYGGKILGTGGYTYSSSPSTDDVISLSLNSTYPTSSPPWQYVSGSKLSPNLSQPTSYATLDFLVEPTGSNPGLMLSFGGDDSSSSNLTGTDSSLIINLTLSGANTSATPTINIIQEPPAWANQPTRRIRHTSNSASNFNSLRLWILGGQKSDGSGTALNELWQYAASKTSPLQGSWSQCPSAPSPTYDHASVTTLDSSNQLRIYAFGGVGSDQNALSMSSIYRFTPKLTSETCEGSWETIALNTTSAPSPRRGHSIVSLSPTQILLYGGASADGQSVYDDMWLLDLSSLRWNNLSSGDSNGPGARWGHVMVRAGSNVIVAFGFGVLGDSHAASPGLGVFNLQNLRWTSNYSPSSLANEHHAGKVLQSSDPMNSPAQNSNGWQVTGSTDYVQPLPMPLTPDESDRQSSSTSSILGVIMGIIGALVIGAASLCAHRYRKKANHKREIEAHAYRQKAFGPDFKDDNLEKDDDQVRLMNQQDSLHTSYVIPRIQAHGSRFDHSATGPLKALVGVGVGVRALWSHKSQEKQKQRFDMLADEESQVCVSTEIASLSDNDDNRLNKCFDRNKALKKYADGFNERVRLPPPPPCPMSEVKQNRPCSTTTRGGLRIWNGLEEPADSQSRFGTSTSFLGASLAPWSDDGRGTASISEYGIYDYLRDPFSDIQSRSVSGSFSDAEQRGSWETSSGHNPFIDSYYGEVGHTREGTGYSSIENCVSPGENNQSSTCADPFSEIETVGQLQPLTSSQSNLSLTSTMGNPLLNSFWPSKALERQGTWWDRLRYGSDKHAADMAPGAVHPIRDPTPAPLMPTINRQFDVNTSSEIEGLEHGKFDYPTDEHGRCRRKASKQVAHAPSVTPNNLIQTSLSSTQTASTATSSMIEAATSQMVVIQRFRSTDSSLLLSSLCSNEGQASSELHTPLGSIATSLEEQDAETSLTSRRNSESRPYSPRPMGPRTLSPGLTDHATPLRKVRPATTSNQPFVKRPPAIRTQTAGSVGVRAMVKQFESPSLVKSESQDSHDNLTSRRLKFERSLVKKPLLFVANPDK